MSCLLTKAVLGAVVGFALHAQPVLDWLHLPPWQRMAAATESWLPFNGGTGFFINADGDFVSPYHLIGDCPYPAVETPEGVLLGTPVASSQRLDIAVIRTGEPRGGYARFPDVPDDPRFKPVVIPRFRGCGGLDSWNVTGAVATGMFARGGGGLAIRASQAIEGGNSGSPVIDSGGAVIGMVVARHNGRSESGIAVDAETIIRFLSDAGVPFQTTPTVSMYEGETFAVAARRYTFPVLCLL